MDRQAKLQDITMGSIHKMFDRILIVHGIWWELGSVTHIEFYEPATDKINEASYAEVAKMLDEKTLVLHQPQIGRTLPRKRR